MLIEKTQPWRRCGVAVGLWDETELFWVVHWRIFMPLELQCANAGLLYLKIMLDYW